MRRIAEVYPDYVGALVTLSKSGQHGAAAHGWTFEYAVRDASMSEASVYKVAPIETPRSKHPSLALGRWPGQSTPK